MNRKGFTLVELLMVVIIIGILVTLAVPNYYRSVERAKGGKARGGMDAIRKAELQYRGAHDIYTNALADLETYDLPNDILDDGSDGDWTYTITTADETNLEVTATRDAGPYGTSTITMNQDGSVDAGTVAEWQ